MWRIWWRAELAHFADLVGSRIALDGPKLRLKAAAAQAIGLTVHEARDQCRQIRRSVGGTPAMSMWVGDF